MRFRLALVAAVAVASVAASPALAAGGPDPEIAALQVSLRSKGMYFGKIDGLAGPTGGSDCSLAGAAPRATRARFDSI